MKSTRITICLLLVMFFAMDAGAFDCERKGFVIGLGGGLAPWIHGSWGDPAQDYTEAEIGSWFLTGYAWDNQNMILLVVDYVAYNDTVDVYRSGELIYQNRVTIYQSFLGFAYSHYFAPGPGTCFVTGGLGLIGWLPQERFYQCCHTGPGMMLGGGFEFTRHFQINANLSFGRTSRDGNDYTHAHAMIALTGVLY